MANKYMIRWEEESEPYTAYFDSFAAADMITGLLTDAGTLAEVWQRVTKEDEEKETETEEETTETEPEPEPEAAEEEEKPVTRRRWG